MNYFQHYNSLYTFFFSVVPCLSVWCKQATYATHICTLAHKAWDLSNFQSLNKLETYWENLFERLTGFCVLTNHSSGLFISQPGRGNKQNGKINSIKRLHFLLYKFVVTFTYTRTSSISSQLGGIPLVQGRIPA